MENGGGARMRTGSTNREGIGELEREVVVGVGGLE